VEEDPEMDKNDEIAKTDKKKKRVRSRLSPAPLSARA
jgi:hypothetical protein